jgi:type I restriction enzyme S subunit
VEYPKYEKYKDCEDISIGRIPEHWILKKLKYQGRICNGKNQKEVIDDDGIYPILGTGGIFGRTNNFLHKKPSVLLGRKGTIDKPIFIESPFWTVDTLFYTDISKETHPKFFFYSCRNIPFNLYKYGSAVPSMTQEDLGNIFLPYPPIQEQQSIANFLDKETTRLDALIAKKQQLIGTLKEKRIAIISKAVTKGLNPDVSMKDSGIEWLGEVPKHWEVKRLKYLSKINPVASEIKHLELSDEVSFVPMESISEKGGMRTDKTKELETVRQGFTYFKEDDVVIAKITPCFENGKGSIAQNLVNNIGFGSTELHVVRCNPENLDFKYFFYISNTHQFLKLGESEMFGAGGQKRVPTKFVKNFPVAYPIDMTEQREIVQFLDKYVGQILSIIDRTQKTISKLQEYKTALISAAVTGKIKVPEQT